MNNPIFDLDNWREIGATLSRNKTRTFLTAFGIFWGTAILAMLMGGAGGLEGLLRRNFDGFATNMAFMAPSRTTISYRGFNKGLEWKLNDADVAAMRQLLPWLDASSSMTGAMVTVAYGSKSTSAYASGVEGGYSSIQQPYLYEGRFINQSDVSAIRKVAVIGKNVSDEIFKGLSPIGKYVSLNGIYYQVVGVAAQTSEASIGGRLDDAVIVPFTALRKATNRGTDVDYFIFTAKQGHTPTEMRPMIERILRSHHPISPDDHNAMMFQDISEQFKMVDNLFIGISFVALFVGAGTLLAGVVGVGNIMWIIVKERTQEIGIRRAIGARRRDIIAQVLSEGSVLTFIAGLAGLCFATLVLTLVDHISADAVHGSAGFEITFSEAVTTMIAFTVLGTAAGLIPAIKAMKIKPIEALNAK